MSELSDIIKARGGDNRGIEHALYKSVFHQRDTEALSAILHRSNSFQYLESIFSDPIRNDFARFNWKDGFELWLKRSLELLDGNSHAQHLDTVICAAVLNPSLQSDLLQHTYEFWNDYKHTAPRGKVWNLAIRLSQIAIMTDTPDVLDECFEVLTPPFNLRQDLWPTHKLYLEDNPKIWVLEKWLAHTLDPLYFQTMWSFHVKYGPTDDLLKMLNCGIRHLIPIELQGSYEDLLVSPIATAQRFKLCEAFDTLAHNNNWDAENRYPPIVSRRIAQVATENIIPPHQWQKWVDKMINGNQLQLAVFLIAATKHNNWSVVQTIHTTHPNYFCQRLKKLMEDPDPTLVEEMIGRLGDDVDRILATCAHETPAVLSLREKIKLTDALKGTSVFKSHKKM